VISMHTVAHNATVPGGEATPAEDLTAGKGDDPNAHGCRK